MYYLFLTREEDLAKYKIELERVSKSIKQGHTPVYSEIRSAKTNLIESLPYNLINAAFTVFFTFFLAKCGLNEIISLGLTLVINNFLGVLSNYIFVMIKHYFRLKLCKRLGVEPTEDIIAAMESLEYQSV